MIRHFQIAAISTIFVVVSLYLWRIAFASSDLAVFALLPLVLTIGTGFWWLTLRPWRVQLDCIIRSESTWKVFLSGRIRTTMLMIAFTSLSVVLLAWQALRASIQEASLMALALFLSALTFLFLRNLLSRHLKNPFAQSYATSIATWAVAIPATVAFGLAVWNFSEIPGSMLDAGFQEALKVGLAQLPERGGVLSSILALPFVYETAKLWVVIQLRDYPVVGWIFSLDSALYGFVLCRTGIVIAQFIEQHILQGTGKLGPQNEI